MKTDYNRTKIIATLGPASSSKETLTNMIRAGLDVARVNFSHGDYATHKETIDLIRSINKQHDTHIGVLADLQGPKIRVGVMEGEGALLVKGAQIEITTKKVIGTAQQIYISYQRFPKDVQPGELILLDDGKIRIKIVSTDLKTKAVAEVIHGGILKSNKGVNLPNTKLTLPSLSEKDLADLDFALEQGVEWIALSFVRDANDIKELRKLIDAKKSRARIIAKIEKPEALENIDAIIDASDAIMVARGDLGVEIPMEKVPVFQKRIVEKARTKAKPVIIATQMMETMMEFPQPTRAEANDVANSVLDGADALMLSGETSVGKFPIGVIEAMQRIIRNVETEFYNYSRLNIPNKDKETFLSDSICYSSCVLAEQVGAKGLIGMTRSGYTGFQLSSHRPKADIFIFTNNRFLLNLLSLVWGVRGLYYDKFVSTDETFQDVHDILKAKKLIKKGDVLINSASMPIDAKGRTNTIKVTKID